MTRALVLAVQGAQIRALSRILLHVTIRRSSIINAGDNRRDPASGNAGHAMLPPNAGGPAFVQPAEPAAPARHDIHLRRGVRLPRYLHA